MLYCKIHADELYYLWGIKSFVCIIINWKNICTDVLKMNVVRIVSRKGSRRIKENSARHSVLHFNYRG